MRIANFASVIQASSMKGTPLPVLIIISVLAAGCSTVGMGPVGPRPERLISGRIHNSDYPPNAFKDRAGGTVGLRFVVAPNGRVSECGVTRSSGRDDLDAITCRLIQQRFRYKPALNAQGQAVPAVVTGEHVWQIVGS
jgi:protein TonB